MSRAARQLVVSRAARQVAGALLLAGSSSLLIACGSGSPSVTPAPVQAARKVPPIPRFVGADPVSSTHTGTVRARPPQPGTDDDEVNSTGASTVDPCTLVSRPEAQAILHASVGRMVDAPQGPTCIYEPSGGASYVTLAVQASGFSKVVPQSQLHHRRSFVVGGRKAYCGTAGGPMLVIPLSAGEFLTVAAPCQVASRFATKALTRIAG